MQVIPSTLLSTKSPPVPSDLTTMQYHMTENGKSEKLWWWCFCGNVWKVRGAGASVDCGGGDTNLLFFQAVVFFSSTFSRSDSRSSFQSLYDATIPGGTETIKVD